MDSCSLSPTQYAILRDSFRSWNLCCSILSFQHEAGRLDYRGVASALRGMSEFFHVSSSFRYEAFTYITHVINNQQFQRSNPRRIALRTLGTLACEDPDFLSRVLPLCLHFCTRYYESSQSARMGALTALSRIGRKYRSLSSHIIPILISSVHSEDRHSTIKVRKAAILGLGRICQGNPRYIDRTLKVIKRVQTNPKGCSALELQACILAKSQLLLIIDDSDDAAAFRSSDQRLKIIKEVQTEIDAALTSSTAHHSYQYGASKALGPLMRATMSVDTDVDEMFDWGFKHIVSVIARPMPPLVKVGALLSLTGMAPMLIQQSQPEHVSKWLEEIGTALRSSSKLSRVLRVLWEVGNKTDGQSLQVRETALHAFANYGTHAAVRATSDLGTSDLEHSDLLPPAGRAPYLALHALAARTVASWAGFPSVGISCPDVRLPHLGGLDPAAASVPSLVLYLRPWCRLCLMSRSSAESCAGREDRVLSSEKKLALQTLIKTKM
eukprot:gnl/Dysnectes_brevis/7303_a12117_288.p1 GENE.gnl/Dysnectes_brevis/7303_a12117_288~~gnl/Dysnectes_brevis/7303_a12117_288.p1  ORF type:complete len:496 (+),score=40.78 gnl/Dysnectes_brevis/7303_a12117_288:131-1618(+)